MTLRIGIVMDPLDSITIYKDSSFAMCLAAQTRGYQLDYLAPQECFVDNARAFAQARALTVRDDASDWFTLADAKTTALSEYDIILMRKDPPFDMEYVYSTYLLELAEKQGAHIINSPRSIRDFNEKLAIARFPQFMPPTLVTRQEMLIQGFLHQHRDIILKPLDSMGGEGIFRVHDADHNVNVIIDTITRSGTRTIMAQRFIPEITKGDKRILMIGGKPVPYALARIPKPGETRGNLSAGGTGTAQPLSAHDQKIAETVGPELVKQGLQLVGLDVIGDYLTEVNVTSPTGMQEIYNQTGFNVASMMVDALTEKLRR